MEKTTLRSLLLLMVITGSIFTFTACGPSDVVQVETDVSEKNDAKIEVKDEVKAKVETKVDETKTDGKPGMNVNAEIKANAEVKTDSKVDAKEENGPATEAPKAVTPKVNTTISITPQPEVKVTTKYNDGSYIKTGGYQSPGGSETVTVNVSVKDDMVQSVSVAGGTDNDVSKNFQKLFIDGVNAQVVGKKLADVKVGVVNGSSLTGIGFNQAIDAIRSSAQK